MTSAAIHTPFNTAQLELLKLFAEGVNEQEMTELKRILLDFKFKRVSDLADKIIDEKGWSAKEIAVKALEMKRSTHKAKNGI